MIRFIAFVSVGILAAATAYGQITLVDAAYMDVSEVLTDISGKSLVYTPSSKLDKQLYFIPFFAFKADMNKKLEVAVVSSPNLHMKQIVLSLLLSPRNKINAMANYIRNEEARAPLDSRFADVQPGRLIGLLFSNLSIVEEDPRIGFRSVILTNFAPQGEIQLFAEVPEKDADQIAESLRAGTTRPQFHVQYQLNANKRISQSDVQANMCLAYETKAAKSLLGAGPVSAKFEGWRVDAAGVGVQPSFLTRDQRDNFEGRMKAEVAITISLGNPEDATFIQTMLGYFDKLFQPLVLDTDANPLGKQLARMAAYDFDPKDLTPDKVDKLVVDVKNFFKSDDQTFSNTEVGASASFLGIGGSANTRFERQELRKRMEDKGWKFEMNGLKYIPKSFQVHVLNQNALTSTGAISGTILRQQAEFANFEHRVPTSILYAQGKPEDDPSVALQSLRTDLKAQSDLLSALSQKIVERGGQLDGLIASCVKFGEDIVFSVKDTNRTFGTHGGSNEIGTVLDVGGPNNDGNYFRLNRRRQ